MEPLEDNETPLEEAVETKPRQNQLLFMNPQVTAAAGGKAAGKRTRPPGARFNRLTEEEQAESDVLEAERQIAIANDPVVRISTGKDPLLIMSTIKAEVAREAAALGYQRLLLERNGKDITAVSGRRIDALKKIADMEIDMRKMGIDHIDIRSVKFQMIFKLWVEMIRVTAEEVLDPKQLDLFFNRLTTEMEGWEEKAEELVR